MRVEEGTAVGAEDEVLADVGARALRVEERSGSHRPY
jgi:hypothetical protein